MHRFLVAGFIALLLAGVASAQRSRYFSNPKQLTNDGESGQAYWSPDGSKLVFQSARGGTGCDQTYVMNADGTDVKMVSTGQGMTMRGYFMADGKRIVYASTHGSGPDCPAKPDQRRGHMESLHPGYDIWVTDLDGAEPKRLTTEDGYDAEPMVNWKTGRIIYSSTSSGDVELWSMDSEGEHKSKLTSAIGYDGEAAFSRDARMLVWRGHHPLSPDGASKYYDLLNRYLTDPMKMEVFLGDEYGMRVSQITNYGCASLAPQFTPDGQRIIFATNMNECNSKTFDLFVVGINKNNLRQVTRLYSFTTSPEFSPDGKKILFTSSFKEQSKDARNIFVADWNEGM